MWKGYWPFKFEMGHPLTLFSKKKVYHYYIIRVNCPEERSIARRIFAKTIAMSLEKKFSDKFFISNESSKMERSCVPFVRNVWICITSQKEFDNLKMLVLQSNDQGALAEIVDNIGVGVPTE
jgi:hypothetical protein